MGFDAIANNAPFSLCKSEKEALLTERLTELTELHSERCPEYKKILRGLSFSIKDVRSYYDLPFIPVRLFKELSLKSVPEEDVIKTMTSSGTTAQNTSKIYLDRVTALNQQKAMVKIVSDFTGTSRMPMIILDCPSVLKDRKKFSARGAGILGFSIFGTKKIYAFDDEMRLDTDRVQKFLSENRGKRVLLFGFTYMIWQFFYKELERVKNEGTRIDFSNAVMIHGGGWKKLSAEAVDDEEFRNRLKEVCGIEHIHDYYGMVEQTGCICMQCECGHFHASVFSDVITRRPIDFAPCDIGEKGIIQVVSSIPESYPGHSLITEDEGVIIGEDDCACGRKGKYFGVVGRIKNAEIRGCSDTFSALLVNDIPPEKEALNAVRFLVGDANVLNDMPGLRSRKPFESRITDFLHAFSRKLMEDSRARYYPDLVTLGFWLRNSSVNRMKQRMLKQEKDIIRLGKGVAFHIAPSNIPVNFAYSLFAGLLCGNSNIVRLPSKDYPQIDIICECLNNLLKEFDDIKPYICLVKYEKNKTINDKLSEICDVRIVWGGDNTIEEIRKSSLPPRATEVTFADRYSIAVIDSDTYMNNKNKERLALEFYNDTYQVDQNACSSPRAVVWFGNKTEEAKAVFWNEEADCVKKRYTFRSIQGIDKLVNMCLAFVSDSASFTYIKTDDNYITRIKVNGLSAELMDYKGNSGFFYEYDAKELTEIRELCNDSHCQTISMLGDDKLAREIVEMGIKGVDRIVPIGHTMDFDLIWDGYNLLERFSRLVHIV